MNWEKSMEYRKLAACLIGEDFHDRRISHNLRNLFLKPRKHDLNRDLKKYEERLKRLR